MNQSQINLKLAKEFLDSDNKENKNYILNTVFTIKEKPKRFLIQNIYNVDSRCNGYIIKALILDKDNNKKDCKLFYANAENTILIEDENPNKNTQYFELDVIDYTYNLDKIDKIDKIDKTNKLLNIFEIFILFHIYISFLIISTYFIIVVLFDNI